MTGFDFERDADRVWKVFTEGGIAIFPTDVGYVMCSTSTTGIERSFAAKQRSRSKFHANSGCMELHDELHDLDTRGRDIVRLITQDYGLPMGCVAPVRLDHPIIRNLDDTVREQMLVDGTIAMLIGAGPMNDGLARRALKHDRLVTGSSANRSLHGVKHRVVDIEPEIIDAADIVLDYGLCRWVGYGLSSTMLNVADLTVIRYGACFDLIQDALRRHMGIELPNPAPS